MDENLNIKPDFLIIGTQKGGTTSLFNYLCKHPNVFSSENRENNKEIHYFDLNYQKGDEWYQDQLASKEELNKCIENTKGKVLIGESSPYYIFHPHCPERIHKDLPNVKLIVLLRNPVYRAYSHHKMEYARGTDDLDFETAIHQEEKRLKNEIKQMIMDNTYNSYAHQHYSYLERGKYINQLKEWLEFFDKEQILTIKSEDMFEDPDSIFKEVCEFLELPVISLNEYEAHNKGNQLQMPDEMKQELNKYFKPYNFLLYTFLGRDFNWEAQ